VIKVAHSERSRQAGKLTNSKATGDVYSDSQGREYGHVLCADIQLWASYTQVVVTDIQIL
jgi:hypothetical protein